MNYVAGSDSKTVKIAASLIAQTQAAMDAGNIAEAERLMSAMNGTMNIPLRIELRTQLDARQ